MEISKVLKVHVDYTEDNQADPLLRNSLIQFCLSIQNSMGFQGQYQPRTFAGKLAWIGLQLRNVVILLTMASNVTVPMGNGERLSPLDDPGMISRLHLIQHNTKRPQM